MSNSRWRSLVGAAVLACAVALPTVARAQGVTTGGIVGQVTDAASGAPLENVQVQVRNVATGLSRGALTRTDGRYTVLGLEPGDDYAVTVRRIGYGPQARERVRVTLSQTTVVNLSLATQATALAAVRVVERAEEGVISPSRTGVSTTIGDSALRRLPTVSRNFTDFVALTPQVATPTTGGISGAGTNNRFNSIQIDGATEADIFGLGDTGQPGSSARARSISIESVKQYQVALSPYDVRQGNFSGVLINAVTKSGSNKFEGSAYGVNRNESLTRDRSYINAYDLTQYGFTLGGPLVRDKVFFFINPEIQQSREPALGPFLGSPDTRVTDSVVTRFRNLLGGYGITNAGTAGLVENDNPLTNLFVRLDANLPFSSQLVLRHNFGRAERDVFSRSTAGSNPTFGLSSNGLRHESVKNATVLQLRTNFASGKFNEFIASYTTIRDRRLTPTRDPQVSVIVPNATLVAGTDRFSQANELDQDVIELTENLTIPLGSHRLTFGSQNQFFKVRNLFAQSSLGVYTFGSLDSLALGRPREYIVGVPIRVVDGQVVAQGDGAVRFTAGQFSGYVQDQWEATNRLNVSAGLRIDVPVFFDKPPYNPVVQEQFGRRTNEIPSGNPQYSPRIGFNWDVTGDGRNQLRGGIGSFVGRPAYVWLANSFQNSGVSGVALLTCRQRGGAGGATNPPQLTAASAATPPTSCGDGTSARAGSEINLLSDKLKFPQNVRTTLGYDRGLGGEYFATFEAMYTLGVNNPFYQNIALDGPLGRDRYGRVMYGDSAFTPRLRVPGRTTVLDVTNQSRDYSVSLTSGISRRFAERYSGSVFYTFTRAREVQGLTSSTAFSQYRFGRATGGDQAALSLSPGRFETPHRIVAQGSYAFPTRTDLSFTYFGQSGANYEYVSNGDLNADGFSLNDPIYVPRSAYDTSEIRFQGNASQVINQQIAFERFINETACLRESRGRILGRNSCRAPWSNLMNVSLNQGLRTFGTQNLSLRLDVFNFLNLLNKEWGEVRQTGEVGPVSLLTYRGKTAGSVVGDAGASNIFTVDPNVRRYSGRRLESNYQMQATVRYSF